jgi:hypothetical protein
MVNGERVALSNGRTAWWNEGMVVIQDANSVEGGTAFIPKDGYQYFLDLK